MSSAVCPGSFDPLTRGHLSVIERCAARFDELVVVVTVNPAKRGMFDVDERIGLIAECTREFSNVRVDRCEGLLVDYCRDQRIATVVKGLRGSTDLDYEAPMAQMNRALADTETMFVLTDPAFAHVSSSLVKEVARLGGDVEPFVPSPVYRALCARLSDAPA